MNLDIRTPAGALFVVLGGLLAVYGLVSDSTIYTRSLGVNINLVWGLAMAAFGGALLLWRRLAPGITRD
jgi:hypothetical protein